MAGQQSPYLQFNPNSFFGGRRIDARPRNVEYEEGTGPRTGLTARRVDPGMGGGLDAFYMSQRYKDLPMSMINREANIRRGQGMMYNPYTGTYQRDSMYNRSGFGFGREPVGDMQPQAPAMTEPQQEWARLAQEKQSGAGALGKIGEKMGLADSAFGPSAASLTTSATGGFAGANPYAGTRAQNIANAKAAGMFDKVRSDYNKKNEAAGYEMDADGNITRNPAIVAKDISEGKQMASDFNRGVDRGKGGNTVSSRYGSGRSTFGIFGPGKPQSMVKDDFGNWVPMNPYLKDKEEVQKSKGMTGGSSVLSQNQTGKTAIPTNPLIKKKDNTNTSLNSSKEEAKSRGSDEKSKEKQVSRKEDFIEAFNRKYSYNKNPDGEFHLSEDGDTIGVFDGGKLITFFSSNGDPEKAVRNYRLYLKAIEDPMAKGDTPKANEYRRMLWHIHLLGSDQDEEIRWFKKQFPDK